MAQLVSECDAMEEFIPEGLVLDIKSGLLTKHGCLPRSLLFCMFTGQDEVVYILK